jgi:hypothetical protein
MSWEAQNRSKDAKTPSAGLAMSKKPEPGCCPIQPYIEEQLEVSFGHTRVSPVQHNSLKEKGK